mmetsp:Transcript_12875/g.37808  ORF Transcript_12875/g.37808 Transcript_12875/m.37808 type:complete len:331 (-) Transcript_12875:803-1795(-)
MVAATWSASARVEWLPNKPCSRMKVAQPSTTGSTTTRVDRKDPWPPSSSPGAAEGSAASGAASWSALDAGAGFAAALGSWPLPASDVDFATIPSCASSGLQLLLRKRAALCDPVRGRSLPRLSADRKWEFAVAGLDGDGVPMEAATDARRCLPSGEPSAAAVGSPVAAVCSGATKSALSALFRTDTPRARRSALVKVWARIWLTKLVAPPGLAWERGPEPLPCPEPTSWPPCASAASWPCPGTTRPRLRPSPPLPVAIGPAADAATSGGRSVLSSMVMAAGACRPRPAPACGRGLRPAAERPGTSSPGRSVVPPHSRPATMPSSPALPFV